MQLHLSFSIILLPRDLHLLEAVQCGRARQSSLTRRTAAASGNLVICILEVLTSSADSLYDVSFAKAHLDVGSERSSTFSLARWIRESVGSVDRYLF